MGMLATVINGLAIQGAIEKLGGKAQVFTSIEMSPVGVRYSKRAVLKAFENDEAAVFVFGTGNPFFTTDSTAALKAVEIDAEVILKGTRVDGVYTADPEKDPSAKKYSTLTFDEAYEKGLKIMDLTAFTMCKENNLPIIVFDMNTKGNLARLMENGDIGTIIQNK
jgi:uridylate kinase